MRQLPTGPLKRVVSRWIFGAALGILIIIDVICIALLITTLSKGEIAGLIFLLPIALVTLRFIRGFHRFRGPRKGV